MAVLADAIDNHDPHANNLWFDVASIVDRDTRPETAARIVTFIRQVGVGRVLYGTDSAQGANLRPREAWDAFRKLPLSPAEFAHIAANVPPYFPAP
jgi:predicted TIM-barrel fold metal-dependent hydrolase